MCIQTVIVRRSAAAAGAASTRHGIVAMLLPIQCTTGPVHHVKTSAGAGREIKFKTKIFRTSLDSTAEQNGSRTGGRHNEVYHFDGPLLKREHMYYLLFDVNRSSFYPHF